MNLLYYHWELKAELREWENLKGLSLSVGLPQKIKDCATILLDISNFI